MLMPQDFDEALMGLEHNRTYNCILHTHYDIFGTRVVRDLVDGLNWFTRVYRPVSEKADVDSHDTIYAYSWMMSSDVGIIRRAAFDIGDKGVGCHMWLPEYNLDLLEIRPIEHPIYQDGR